MYRNNEKDLPTIKKDFMKSLLKFIVAGCSSALIYGLICLVSFAYRSCNKVHSSAEITARAYVRKIYRRDLSLSCARYSYVRKGFSESKVTNVCIVCLDNDCERRVILICDYSDETNASCFEDQRISISAVP